MNQPHPIQTTSSPGCLGAGGPVWYAVLAVSFLSCSLNPVGAAGLAMHILTPHDVYSKPIGWTLTAGSFVIAIMGFIATERIAYLERQRRPMEIASLLTCGAGLLAFVLGFTMPTYVMWPIAAVLVMVGGFGFRGAASLPVPGEPGTGLGSSAAVNGPAAPRGGSARGARTPITEAMATPGRKRRRRRRKKRPAPPSPSGETTPGD